MSARIEDEDQEHDGSVTVFTSWSHNRHTSVPGNLAILPGMARTHRALGEAEALASAYERGYAQSDLLTLGIEEELILVDPESLEPIEAIELVLGAAPDPRVTAEFRAAQVELVTAGRSDGRRAACRARRRQRRG